MTTSDASASLASRLADPGFTPSVKLLPELIQLLGAEDEAVAKAAERAILRIEAQYAARIAKETLAAIAPATRPLRGRLAHLLGRLAQDGRDTDGAIAGWLTAALEDEDPKTRRAAARGLGKLPKDQRTEAMEAALASAFDRATNEDDKRAIGVALGKTGSDAAGQRLAGLDLGRASLIVERELARKSPGAIDLDKSLGDRRARVWFHTRSGLEDVLAEELVADTPFARPRFVAPGIVEADLEQDTSLRDALLARTSTHLGFPLAPTSGSDIAAAIVERICSDEALAIFRVFTRVGEGGAIRFRLHFARGGHRRSVVWRVAELVRSKMPELVNDPKESTWEVVVHDQAGAGAETTQIKIELVPRGFADDRFAYREDLVPASSHPVIAAALARVAFRVSGSSDDDVVWDPFVGAGAELVERARLGPYRHVYGTDIDPKAVAFARSNLERAGVSRATITVADATTYVPDKPANVVITNPPMGRRVERGGHADLLERFLSHARRRDDVLVKGGAIVWLLPQPDRMRSHAEAEGFETARAFAVDMGGFSAELTIFVKSPRAPV